jgi:very-short-patch-repair endonuclease
LFRYRENLKSNAQKLRKEMTESEQIFWGRLRKKQILGVQFYRQKPLGNYIVDFFAPKAKLVIEVDGSQHMATPAVIRAQERDSYLGKQNILVLRFNDSEVLRETEGVMEVIFRRLSERISSEIPPLPPFKKWGQIR